MIHTLIVIGLTSLIWGSALYLRHYLDKKKTREKKMKYEDSTRQRFKQLAGIRPGKRYRVTSPTGSEFDEWGDYNLRFNLANMVEDVWIPVRGK